MAGVCADDYFGEDCYCNDEVTGTEVCSDCVERHERYVAMLGDIGVMLNARSYVDPVNSPEWIRMEFMGALDPAWLPF